MTAIWGGLLLFVGGGLLGCGISAQQRRRVSAVVALCGSLRQMERRLTLYFTPLPELFCQENSIFASQFSDCGQRLNQGDSMAVCWDRLVENLPVIGGEEREILRPLGNILGQFEGTTQGEALLRTAVDLDRLAEGLAEDGRRLSRVYPALGGTAGAFLAILLG